MAAAGQRINHIAAVPRRPIGGGCSIPDRMGGGLRIYPYLIAVNFPLCMWLSNLAEDPTTPDLIVTFAATLALAALADWAVGRLWRDPVVRSLVLSLLILGVFGYGHAFQLLAGPGWMHRHVVSIWLTLFGLAAAAIFFLRKTPLPRAVSSLLRAAGPILLVVQIAWAFPLIIARLRGGEEVSPHPLPAHSAARLAAGNPTSPRPDVYYVILDGYARGDVMQQIHGFDNREFLDALRARGFYVAAGARSNYAQTRLSLASSLSMAYLPEFPPGDAYELHHQEIRRLRKSNRVAQRLRELGYRYRYLGSGYMPVDASADEELFPRGRDGGYVRAFLSTTAFELLCKALRIWDPGSDQIAILQYQLENVARAKRRPDPLFTFAHLACPHEPYLYDRHGPLPRRVAEHEANSAHYVEQVRYLSRRVLELLDAIDRTSGPEAVVLLQADHGTDLLGMPPDPNPDQLLERTSILSAYRCPPRVRRRLYATITPVNSFRLLFSGLFADELPLLEDRSYYSSYEAPLRLVEVPPIRRPKATAEAVYRTIR